MNKLALVVDDEPVIRQMFGEMLSMVNIKASEAEDGRDALEKIIELQPDVIILDVLMPKMDGLTLCKILRHKPHTADLPIIIVSGKAQAHDIQEGLLAGADRYLCKPVPLAKLLQNVQELVC